MFVRAASPLTQIIKLERCSAKNVKYCSGISGDLRGKRERLSILPRFVRLISEEPGRRTPMTVRVKPVIVVSVPKKANGRLVLNYTRPELPVLKDRKG